MTNKFNTAYALISEKLAGWFEAFVKKHTQHSNSNYCIISILLHF